LSTLGVAECLSLASSFGVTDLTLPAFDNEPCDGTFFTSYIVLPLLVEMALINIHTFGMFPKHISLRRRYVISRVLGGSIERSNYFGWRRGLEA